MLSSKYIYSIIIVLFFSSFQSDNAILFKNDKVEFYMERQGIQTNFLSDNFKENERIDVVYYFYTEPKKYIGTESLTTNKKLIQNYFQEYQLRALEKKQRQT